VARHDGDARPLTEAESPGRLSNRERKIHYLLLALLEISADNAGDPQLSHIRGARHGSWDDAPKKRPCECRAQWQRGRLCLACNNTGWRRIADGEHGTDPYAHNVSAVGFSPVARTSYTAPAKVRSESAELDAEFGQQTWFGARLMRLHKLNESLGPTVPLLQDALARMKLERPDLYKQLSDAAPDVLRWLSKAIDAGIYVPTWARRKYEGSEAT
jgi:hypothetical protein